MNHSLPCRSYWLPKALRVILFVGGMCCAAWCSVSVSLAEEKPAIRWLVWDFKPDFIATGPYAGQGYGDKLLAHLKAALPQYEHSQLYVNGKRWAVEALREQTCTPLLWQGFLPNDIVYSHAYGVTAPYVLVAHGKRADAIGHPDQPVSLAHVLKHRALTLGVLPVYFNRAQQDTRYPVLHEYIAPYIGTEKVVEFGGGSNQLNLQLLDGNRVDYVIENPLTAPTQAKLAGAHNPYVHFRIQEHRVHKKVAVACNNNAFGQRVIARINPLINDAFIQRFLRDMEVWNGGDKYFRKIVVDYFIHGIHSDDIID